MLRNFLGGNAVFAFFERFPWMPIYFALIFILHPDLGLVAVFGGIMVFVLGFLTERFTRKRLESATMLTPTPPISLAQPCVTPVSCAPWA